MEIIHYDVTCIMPVFNTEKYVKEALLSVVQQQGNFKLQIIVVDDGSTDNSVPIIKELQHNHDNIELYEQENSGPAVARNFAMSRAKGHYIMFVDSDDLLPSDAIKNLHVNIELNNSHIAVGMFEAFNRHRTWVHESMRFFVGVTKAVTDLEDFPELINNMSPWNKLYRSDFIRENQLQFLEEAQLREDIYFVCNALYKAERITLIPDIVYRYRGRDEKDASLTSRIDMKVFYDIVLVSNRLDVDQMQSHYAKNTQVWHYRYQNELNALVYRLWPYVERNTHVDNLLSDIQKFLEKIGNDVIMTASSQKRAVLYKIRQGEFSMAVMLIRADALFNDNSLAFRLKKKSRALLKKLFWPVCNALFSPLVSRLKRQYGGLWLIGEQHGNAAMDTGYQFFLFCRKSYPELPIYFVTKHGNIRRDEAQKVGNILSYGSLKHYLFARTAEVFVFNDSFKDIFASWSNINKASSMKLACFLQHGIFALKYSHDYYCKRAVEARDEQIDLMVVSSEREQKYVADSFGYSEDALIVTGLSRFDRLYDSKNAMANNVILFTPTWRNYLKYVSDEVYLESLFHKKIKALTQSKKLWALLEAYDFTMHVCFHHAAAKFTKHYADNTNVKFSSMNDVDLFYELIHSKMLITDYSSVCFNMAYIERPVAFYQFDAEEFIVSEGGSFIDYKTELFGVVSDEAETIVDEIEYNIKNGFEARAEYKKKSDSFFAYRDNNNSQRIFDALRQKLGQYDG